MDFYHAVQSLAAVGRALFGEDKDQLQAWLKPLVQQLKNESAVKVIRQREPALAGLPEGLEAQAVAKEVHYFDEHQARMDLSGRTARGPTDWQPTGGSLRSAGPVPVQAPEPILESGGR